MHEGRHIYDGESLGWPRFNDQEGARTTERNAYRTMAAYAKVMGMEMKYTLPGASQPLLLTRNTANRIAELSVRSSVNASIKSAARYNADIDRDYKVYLDKNKDTRYPLSAKPPYVKVDPYAPPKSYK